MYSYRSSVSYRVFTVFNYLVLSLLALSCLLPFVQVLSVSLSSAQAVSAGQVKLFPVELTFASYESVFGMTDYLRAFGVSLKRIVLGVSLSMLMTVMIAYPLSKESSTFRMRTVYVWIFVFTTLFHGGLIPTYMVVKEMGLINSIWALVLPHAVPVFNVVLLLNFFRSLPKEMEESAKIDGANHWTILTRIFLPLSLPALATILLFTCVGHWNSWFDGVIYMNNPEDYPLQTYLHMNVVTKGIEEMTPEEMERFFLVNDRTGRAAQILVAALPILMVYPFLQRYFMKGIVLGSVKE
ncbi:carbohydrate ABC transporter permease [Paenibacillus koleovorans]|uniref:carbohydrate ABC transporter permease n=1 Tax=Paenibacillus koleovorans TaxID=121608 RepID=UPI000FDAA208|nr:carbohydrate ABC transporter permease [Paenibacillus koleovorans]